VRPEKRQQYTRKKGENLWRCNGWLEIASKKSVPLQIQKMKYE